MLSRASMSPVGSDACSWRRKHYRPAARSRAAGSCWPRMCPLEIGAPAPGIDGAPSAWQRRRRFPNSQKFCGRRSRASERRYTTGLIRSTRRAAWSSQRCDALVGGDGIEVLPVPDGAFDTLRGFGETHPGTVAGHRACRAAGGSDADPACAGREACRVRARYRSARGRIRGHRPGTWRMRRRHRAGRFPRTGSAGRTPTPRR